MAAIVKYTVVLLVLAWSITSYAKSPEDSVFWTISRDGEHRGYLLGTIHSEDPRVLEYTPEFLELLTTSHFYAMELVPDLVTMQQLLEFMQLDNDQSLESLIGKELFENVVTALDTYSVPRGQVSGMKPWAAMMTLSVPPPKSGLFMDFSLSLRAAGAGVKVVGLETLNDQLSFLENLSLDQQIELLEQAVAEFEQVGAVHNQMVDTYLEDGLGTLESQAEEQMAVLNAETREYFIQEGIVNRNHRMLDSARKILDDGTAVIAVGALHLPGEEGLIELLKRDGFELAPSGVSPFIATE